MKYARWSALLITCALAVWAQLAAQTPARIQTNPEERTARYFESIRKSPPQEWAFLIRMPKGADLHNHLSGAIYAESYIQWASDNGLCINTVTMALSAPPANAPCDPESGQPPAKSALTNGALYGKMIDAWSMRNWQLSGQSGHDHFFDTFLKGSSQLLLVVSYLVTIVALLVSHVGQQRPRRDLARPSGPDQG